MKSITSFFVLFFVFSNLSFGQGHPDLPALKAFYESTNGDFWLNNEGWKEGVNDPTDNPCIGWHGVSCNGNNRVIKIDLRVNNINGELPEEMAGLTYLKEINFFYNSISGPVPPFLGEFAFLKDMSFSQNQLEGPIPPELGNSPSLVEIDFRRNNLTGTVPPELGQLTHLERLDLAVNDFEGSIPEEIGNLTNLTYLSFRWNKMGGEIPSSLTNLTSLRTLDISSNYFTGPIPSFLGEITSLFTLSLNKNNFTGEIPESLVNISGLQNLDVSENDLTGQLFDLVSQFPILRSLKASYNDFSGTIPENILDKTKLTGINISYNNFTGTIPGVFGEQSFYNELFLNNNDFSGCLSPSLHVFCGDEDIDFSNNPQLPWKGNMNAYCMSSGSLDDQIGVECSVLNLVSETINENCECLPSCEHPDYIGLMSIYSGTYGNGWNKRDGWKEGAAGNNCDPCSWYGVECNEDNRVISVSLPQNNLRGSLLNQIGQLSELQYLSLNSNDIGGQLPESLFTLTNLVELNLGYNNFYGSIPENLGDLEKLTELSFANSNLTGSIPSSVENLTELTILSIPYNEITGPLPNGITNLTKLEYLSLDGNDISGSIPEDIGNLSSLKSMRMHSNKLSGSIPASLGDLENLFILYLQDNKLSGCFDSNLLNLCDVGEIRFTDNIDLSWGGEFDSFCATSGTSEEQDGAFCGLGGSGVMKDCECMKSEDMCFTPEGILCKEWVQDLITELQCYDFGFGQRQSYSLAVSKYNEDPVLVAFIGGEIASEVYSTQNVYTCDGELLESCSYSLGTNCPDSVTIFSQLVPYPTKFYHCMEDVLPDCPPQVQHPDYQALVDFYNNTQGIYWANNFGWKLGVQDTLSNPCDGWYGIECDEDNRVTKIILENNKVTGEIQPSIAQLTRLEHLDLYTNKISGDALAHISKLNELTFLNLSDNELSGPISSSIGALQNITYLNLGWNNFTGSIPSEVANCSELVYLFFDVNQLTGEIPSEIAQLDHLEWLRFNENDLSGCIPLEFQDLCSSVSMAGSENPKLPWSGDLIQFCVSIAIIDDQTGAPCDDGDDSNGTNDIIHEDCSCGPILISTGETIDRNVSIFPNPVQNTLYLSGELEEINTFRFTDIVGKTIKQSQLVSNQISLDDLNKGIYFLELYYSKDNKTEVFKIVKE